MSTVENTKLTTDELLRKFAETAKVAGTVFTLNKEKIVNPKRADYVAEMQALGAEIRSRNPRDKLRDLFDDPDPDVRGWAGPQFGSIDPEWASATMTGLFQNLSTRTVLAWRGRILQGPLKYPTVGEMTVPQLLERFVDACERCYGSTRFLDEEQGGYPTMKAYNKISGEPYAIARELNARDQLKELIPLLNHPVITVRQKAASYCLPVATDEAIPILERIADAKEFPESSAADWTLRFWRNGEYCAFPKDLQQVRV
jgi:hypothetical protein